MQIAGQEDSKGRENEWPQWNWRFETHEGDRAMRHVGRRSVIK